MAPCTIGGAVPDELREVTAAYLDGRCSTHDFVAQIVALLTEANVDAVMDALPRAYFEDWVAVAATEIPRPGDDGASDHWTVLRPSAEAFAAFDAWLVRWDADL